jgi:glucose/arabinose dehydrogenase
MARLPRDPALTLTGEIVGEGFFEPVGLASSGDDRLFVLERSGRVFVLLPKLRTVLPRPFLDLSREVATTNWEQGLLGLVFHPGFASNGTFFVHYVHRDGSVRISRFRSNEPSAHVADRSSEEVLLTVPQPSEIHHGGGLAFGPDGFLYVGLGDGELSDPPGRAQDPTVLLGKILRLDVDHRAKDAPYRIPPDNPFAFDDDPTTRGEIWCLGLRNPWRFSFDAETERWFIGDVGQSAREEINVVGAAEGLGANFGWNCLEGSAPFGTDPCTPPEHVLPIFEYSHADGCVVVGGFVYRGSIAALAGRYVFADFCTGRLMSLSSSPAGAWGVHEIGDFDGPISSFGCDARGELYAVGYVTGAVYRLVPKTRETR